MVKKILLLILTLLLTIPAITVPAFSASGCTVNYYYTSQQNPEPVPKATKGSLSGTKWKVIPSGPAKAVYSKAKNGRTMSYTFDGWYTNINCVGTKYLPGKETTALTPDSSSGQYTINLYGRWVYKRSPESPTRQSTSENSQNAADPANKGDESADGETDAASPQEDMDDAEEQAETTVPEPDPSEAKQQKITSLSAYTFSDKGQTRSLGASVSSGLILVFASDNPKVVSVDSKGVMRSVAPGSTSIKIRQAGNDQFEPAEVTVPVAVAGYRGREEALAPWRHLLIDTFFHINGRKYSLSKPGKYWTDGQGNWSGKTGRKGNTQSCITLPTVSLKRTGLLSHKSGNIWLRTNMSSKPNGTVKRLKRTSLTLHISYPHKSLRGLAKSGKVSYGDIVCRSGHTFVYMGKDSEGHPLIYESGTNRNIGNGTRVSWGHHSGGHANKLTGKINKQIRNSNAIGAKWRSGQISDSAFRGHKASGANLKRSIHIVCSIRTFTVRTSCTNGTISLGNTYMAGQNITVSYSPVGERTLDFVEVDGKRVDRTKYGKSFTFSKLSANHSINVVYK